MKPFKLYFVACATAVALTAAAGYAQNNPHEHAAPPAGQTAGMDHQAMIANMQADQQKLDDLVAQMNAATGPDKVDKIATVVTEMVAMRKHAMMMMMHGGDR